MRVRMKRNNRIKSAHERVVRLNISLPPGLVNAGKKILLDGSYAGFSDYFAAKIRRDARLDPEDKVAA